MTSCWKFHTNAISTVEVLQEPIEIAKDIRAARQRGEEQGLTADEMAILQTYKQAEKLSAAWVAGGSVQIP